MVHMMTYSTVKSCFALVGVEVNYG